MNKPSTYILLPTNKPSNLFLLDGKLIFDENGKWVNGLTRNDNQYLYILLDDEIKEGDSFIDTNNEVSRCKEKDLGLTMSGWRKIIATTNPKLSDPFSVGLLKKKIECVAKISQSDIEYIISLYNESKALERLNEVWGDDEDGKYQQHYIDKVAESDFNKLCDNQGHYKPSDTGFRKGIWGVAKNIWLRIFVRGYNQCLQDNKEKQFTLEDINSAMNEMFNYTRNPDKRSIMDFKNDFIKSVYKLKSKNDTVMVEYENVNSGWQQMANSDKVGSTHVPDKYVPKVKDGYIVIVR